jgi:hypothetical protein
MLDHIPKSNHSCVGQSTVEFCFGLFIVLLLFFALVQAVRWVVLEKIELRVDFERSLQTGSGAYQQLNPHFHRLRPLDMEY